MSVFDVNGSVLPNVYGYDGFTVPKAYDTDKNIVFDSSQIAVMAFNVGCFYSEYYPAPASSGDVFYLRHKGIFDKYNLDFCGMSEWYNPIGVIQSSVLMDEFFQTYYPDYTPYIIANAAMTSAFLAIPESVTLVRYTAQGSNIRYYQKSYITLKGKTVCCILVHLDLQDSIRVAQLQETLDAVQNEEYFIILGDFNFNITTVGDTEYNKSIKVALDLGYNSAQNAEQLLMTWYSGQTVEDSSNAYALDNIITSPNIQINRVMRDETKLKDGLCEEYGIIIDHLPLVAYCTIT